MICHGNPGFAFVFLLFCLIVLVGSTRTFPETAYSKAIPLIKANFTRLSDESFTYYAVYDLRNGNMGYPYVRILTMTTTSEMRFRCRFKNGQQVQARLYEFSENHLMPFGVYYANCKVPMGESVHGSIEVLEEWAARWVQVPVTYRIEDEHKKIDYQLDYATCVPVLFGEKYTSRKIIEFMELNRLLGSQRVTIYTDLDRITADQWKALKFYADTGFMQVIDFRLPFDPEAIWYHGQLAVVADCLMRHTTVAKFVGFHDLDEYIVPMKKTNVVDELKESFTGKIGSLRISTQYTSSEEMYDVELISLDAFDHGSLDRRFTKCVLRPEMGIHHTSRVIQDDYESLGADDGKLRLFHYKQRGGGKKNYRIYQVYGPQLKRNYDLITNNVKSTHVSSQNPVQLLFLHHCLTELPLVRYSLSRSLTPFAVASQDLALRLEPKDDLEGWLYMVIYMILGRLPWYDEKGRSWDHGITRERKTYVKEVGKRELFGSLPPEWVAIYNSINQTRRTESAPYDFVRRLLMNVIVREGYNSLAPFDWQLEPRLKEVMESTGYKEEFRQEQKNELQAVEETPLITA